MGILFDVVNVGLSSDVITVNCIERISYSEWLRQREAEYRGKSGPVTTRVDKAECERLVNEFEARNALAQDLR